MYTARTEQYWPASSSVAVVVAQQFSRLYIPRYCLSALAIIQAMMDACVCRKEFIFKGFNN